jgi:hypothetical protein
MRRGRSPSAAHTSNGGWASARPSSQPKQQRRFDSPTRCFEIKTDAQNEKYHTMQRFNALARRAQDITKSSLACRGRPGYAAFCSSTYRCAPVAISDALSRMRTGTAASPGPRRRHEASSGRSDGGGALLPGEVALIRDSRDPRLVAPALRVAYNEPLLRPVAVNRHSLRLLARRSSSTPARSSALASSAGWLDPPASTPFRPFTGSSPARSASTRSAARSDDRHGFDRFQPNLGLSEAVRLALVSRSLVDSARGNRVTVTMPSPRLEYHSPMSSPRLVRSPAGVLRSTSESYALDDERRRWAMAVDIEGRLAAAAVTAAPPPLRNTTTTLTSTATSASTTPRANEALPLLPAAVDDGSHSEEQRDISSPPNDPLAPTPVPQTASSAFLHQQHPEVSGPLSNDSLASASQEPPLQTPAERLAALRARKAAEADQIQISVAPTSSHDEGAKPERSSTQPATAPPDHVARPLFRGLTSPAPAGAASSKADEETAPVAGDGDTVNQATTPATRLAAIRARRAAPAVPATTALPETATPVTTHHDKTMPIPSTAVTAAESPAEKLRRIRAAKAATVEATGEVPKFATADQTPATSAAVAETPGGRFEAIRRRKAEYLQQQQQNQNHDRVIQTRNCDVDALTTNTADTAPGTAPAEPPILGDASATPGSRLEAIRRRKAERAEGQNGAEAAAASEDKSVARSDPSAAPAPPADIGCAQPTTALTGMSPAAARLEELRRRRAQAAAQGSSQTSTPGDPAAPAEPATPTPVPSSNGQNPTAGEGRSASAADVESASARSQAARERIAAARRARAAAEA